MFSVTGQPCERMRAIREEVLGHDTDTIPRLAEELGVPAGTWQNYEAGVTIPGTIMLRFVVFTGVNPGWLLTGEGERYLRPAASPELQSEG